MDSPDYDGKWRAFWAIGVAFVTNVFSMSMVFVALPSIADDYDITLRAVGWVVIAQALTISSLMMPMGRLADLVGRRRMHLSGLALFGIGSLAVSLAPTFGLLIAARVIMAIGNAMGQSVGTAMVVAVFPPHERGKAIGSQTTAVAIGAASGPIVGGLLLSILPWEALFQLLLIPIAIAFVAGLVILDEKRVTPPGGQRRLPFDPVGALTSGLGVILLVLVVNNPFDVPWLSWQMFGGAVAMIIAFTVFVRWEQRVEAPMFDIGLFSNPTFSRAAGARIAGFMAATVTFFLVPVLLVSLRGMSEATAGSVMFLNSLGLGLSAQVVGRLSDRLGARRFMLLGFALMASTSVAFSLSDENTPIGLFAVTMLFQGLAMGTWNVPNNSTIMGTVGAEQHGLVGAFTNLARNIGNVTGQALAAVVVVTVMSRRGFDVPLGELADNPGAGNAFVAGWRVVFTVCAVLSAIGFALTLPVGKRSPDHTHSTT